MRKRLAQAIIGLMLLTLSGVQSLVPVCASPIPEPRGCCRHEAAQMGEEPCCSACACQIAPAPERPHPDVVKAPATDGFAVDLPSALDIQVDTPPAPEKPVTAERLTPTHRPRAPDLGRAPPIG